MPASPDTLSTLLIEEDQASILAAGLALAATLGVPTTSWQPGDPTRSLYMLEALILEQLEQVVVGFIQSGFLDYAQGEWLTVVAQQVFGVTVPPATFAETDVTLTNSGGGVYLIDPGDLTFKCSATGATYHNTTGGTLSGPGTLDVTVVADVAGSASSAGATEIDTLVTTLLGVTCSNAAAAIGQDVQSAAATIAQCRNKLGSLSPNGPAAAYSYVALNPTLTGINTITRVRVYPDSSQGIVQIYVAGASGAVSGGDVTAVYNAINEWATPLCITTEVSSAAPITINITASIWVYANVNQTNTQIEAAVQSALQSFFAARPIGGDIIPPAATGFVYNNMIASVIAGVFPGSTFDVAISGPVSDTSMPIGGVAQLGVLNLIINRVPSPQ